MSEQVALQFPPEAPRLSAIQQQKLSGTQITNTEITPGPGSISWSDIGKGLTAAIALATFPMIEQVLANHSWDIDWSSVGQTALNTALMYLGVKLFQPMQQITTFKKPKRKKQYVT